MGWQGCGANSAGRRPSWRPPSGRGAGRARSAAPLRRRPGPPSAPWAPPQRSACTRAPALSAPAGCSAGGPARRGGWALSWRAVLGAVLGGAALWEPAPGLASSSLALPAQPPLLPEPAGGSRRAPVHAPAPLPGAQFSPGAQRWACKQPGPADRSQSGATQHLARLALHACLCQDCRSCVAAGAILVGTLCLDQTVGRAHKRTW